MGRGFWVLAALMATAVAAHGQHHVEPPITIPAYVAGNPEKRTVTPPNGTVISGTQVIGSLDWAWRGSQNGAHWETEIPYEPECFHLTRFEGIWKPNPTQGGGQGVPPPTPTWEMDVPVAEKCNWYKIEIGPLTPPAPRLEPTYSGPNEKIMSYAPPQPPALRNQSWIDLLMNVNLGFSENGRPISGEFRTRGAFSPTYEKNDVQGVLCEKCQNPARKSSLPVKAKCQPPWTAEINLAQWAERENPDVTEEAKAAWNFDYASTITHEERHKTDYEPFYVQPVNLAYSKVHRIYTFTFCKAAFPDGVSNIIDMEGYISREFATFQAEVKKADEAWKKCSDARDAKDYPDMLAELKKHVGMPLGQIKIFK